MESNPLDLVYDGLREKGRQRIRNHRKPPLRFRASEVDQCRRRIWYRLSGYTPAPKDPGLSLYGPAGDFAHDSTRWLFKYWGATLAGLTFDPDTGLVEETMNATKSFGIGDERFDLVCRADGMILFNDIWHLLEVKSVGSYKYGWMDKALQGTYPKYKPGGPDMLGQYLDDTYRSYTWQASIGGMMFNLSHAYLLIVNRSECNIGFLDETTGLRHPGKVWEIDNTLVDYILERCGGIAKAVRDKKAPPCAHVASHKECATYCDFKYLCHGAAKRRLQGLEPAVVYPDETLADKVRNP